MLQYSVGLLLLCLHGTREFILPGHRCPSDQSVSSYLHHIGADYQRSGAYGVHDGARDAVEVVQDPFHSGCYVLKVNYAAGSHSRTDDRAKGAQFFITPHGYPHGANDVTISYDVLFDSSFDFVQGGKLPGTWGYNTKCSGGRDSNHCISTRFMWRADGECELYLYFPKGNQVPDFSHWSHSQSHGVTIETHGDYGVSFRTSSMKFRKHHWTNMRQQIHLNSVHSSGHGNPDGWLAVWFDSSSHPTFNLAHMVLRKYSSVQVDGIFFSTFFGGHTSEWATPHDTFTLFKNFEINVNH